MEAFEHSQFEQHVRAIMGMPLGSIKERAPAAVMLNLLYEDAFKAACPAQPEQLAMNLDESLPADSSATVHWYGKSTGQMGRKMGHLTATARTVDDARLTAEATLHTLRHWPAETVSAKEQTPS
jgi:5-(carboxyamino)imidazole ribonucleotide synthase